MTFGRVGNLTYYLAAVLSGIFLFGIVSVGCAQQSKTKKLAKLNDQLSSLLDIYQDYELLSGSYLSMNKIDSLFSVSNYNIQEQEESPRMQLLDAKIQQEKNHLGISLEAGHLENFSGGFFNVADIFYQRRTSVGLQWDILSGGIVENGYDFNILEKREQVVDAVHTVESRREAYQKIHQRLESYFTGRKIDLMNEYLERISSLRKIMIKLYHLGYVDWERVLEITSQKAEMEQKRNTLQEYQSNQPKRIVISSGKHLPVLEIELESIHQRAKSLGAVDSLALLEGENLDTKYHPLENISLSTSFEYNLYDNATGDLSTGGGAGPVVDREFFSAGIDLSIPIPLNSRADKMIAEARKEMLKNKIEEQKQENKEEAVSLFENYQKNMETYLSARHDFTIQKERIQKAREKRKLESSYFNAPQMLQQIVTHYELAIQVLDQKKKPYDSFLRLIQNIDPEQISEIASPINGEFMNTES